MCSFLLQTALTPLWAGPCTRLSFLHLLPTQRPLKTSPWPTFGSMTHRLRWEPLNGFIFSPKQKQSGPSAKAATTVSTETFICANSRGHREPLTQIDRQQLCKNVNPHQRKQPFKWNEHLKGWVVVSRRQVLWDLSASGSDAALQFRAASRCGRQPQDRPWTRRLASSSCRIVSYTSSMLRCTERRESEHFCFYIGQSYKTFLKKRGN